MIVEPFVTEAVQWVVILPFDDSVDTAVGAAGIIIIGVTAGEVNHQLLATNTDLAEAAAAGWAPLGRIGAEIREELGVAGE